MGDNNCIFCKIVSGSENNEILYQNDEVIVFRDIHPAAKNHLLSVSRVHLKDAKALLPEHKELVQNMYNCAKEALKKVGGDLNDVRYGFHWPPFQSIYHLHLHTISPSSEMSFLSRAIFKENSFWFVPPEYVLSRL